MNDGVGGGGGGHICLLRTRLCLWVAEVCVWWWWWWRDGDERGAQPHLDYVRDFIRRRAEGHKSGLDPEEFLRLYYKDSPEGKNLVSNIRDGIMPEAHMRIGIALFALEF